MKVFTNGLKWATAAVLLVAMTAAPAFANKTTPATDKNTGVPAVPRAIPDLIPYHKFDPPTNKLFDLKNLTISGDIRIRPEIRNNVRFGLSGAGSTSTQGVLGNRGTNDFFVQQWVRLGLHYAISSDVVFFFQPQVSSDFGNQGPNGSSVTGAGASVGSGTLYTRQAFILVRNFGVKNLGMKAGRQLMVWGNHRLFGHFDWNNVGFSHDGVTFQYKGIKAVTIEAGWLRSAEGDCLAGGVGGCAGGAGGSAIANGGDADIIFVRTPMKFAGVVIEPTWIWQNRDIGAGSVAGTAATGGRPTNQSRHTVGARLTTKRAISKVRVDSTFEGYYQFGSVDSVAAGSTNGRSLDISAYALHFDAGVTLPVPMQPRLGADFDIASGDDDNNACAVSTTNMGCNGTANTFSQLYPTNHIHFGYMDRMAWKNMVHWAVSLQLRPTKDSHLDIAGHWFSLQSSGDNWYGANQAAFIFSPTGNTEDDLGSEVDVVYTMFFTPGNHVGWQIGGGTFFAGDFVDGNPTAGSGRNLDNASNESWGYTQLWINF